MYVKLVKAMTGKELLEKFQGKILIGYKMEALRKVAKVFDFLYDIKKHSSREQKILNNWALFFVNKEIPFVVIEHGDYQKLWKEKVVEE
jgi:hypothetical protein